MRKGFVYKKFGIRQLETVNVKPTTDERAQFLDIYESNLKERRDNDSSDEDPEEFIKHIKHDFSNEIGLSDKIQVIKGEL